MTPSEIVDKSIALSETYDEISTKISNTAKKLLKAGEINHLEYKQIMDNYYMPLMKYSTNMLIDTVNEITADLQSSLTQIESSSNKLKSVCERLDKAEKIFKAVVYVLASAATVASFIAAPSTKTATAAGETIVESFEAIGKIV